ncbi:hypothetical protein [Plantactinospora endophytica]|uniref:hypothetical protein n=1 Tax=Plantactinospora endophytica TaxID=673535 RepID=UPI001941B5FF|nr:hypothetical protein [Plantactinospora endophytica]
MTLSIAFVLQMTLQISASNARNGPNSAHAVESAADRVRTGIDAAGFCGWVGRCGQCTGNAVAQLRQACPGRGYDGGPLTRTIWLPGQDAVAMRVLISWSRNHDPSSLLGWLLTALQHHRLQAVRLVGEGAAVTELQLDRCLSELARSSSGLGVLGHNGEKRLNVLPCQPHIMQT